MFGYVKPQSSELRLREYECYRAYYCGLCRAMGKCTGQCSRMTLSYDMVFLALTRCWLQGERPTFQKRRCLPHPFRRRLSVEPSPQLNYCADASALLSYRKLSDDLADEKGLRRIKARAARLFLRRAYKKAKKRHPALDARIGEALQRLAVYERDEQAPSPDAPADIFGDLMRELFVAELEGTSARLAAELGRSLGRWIYLTDAADDLREDRRRQRFNPYALLFADPPEQPELASLRTALTSHLCDAESAFLLMGEPPAPEMRELIANILYLGLPATADRVLASMTEPTHSKSEKETDHE